MYSIQQNQYSQLSSCILHVCMSIGKLWRCIPQARVRLNRILDLISPFLLTLSNLFSVVTFKSKSNTLLRCIKVRTKCIELRVLRHYPKSVSRRSIVPSDGETIFKVGEPKCRDQFFFAYSAFSKFW